MEQLPDFGVDQTVMRPHFVTLLDPYRYILEADQALCDGSRDNAVALIAQAYLAFDLLSADCI